MRFLSPAILIGLSTAAVRVLGLLQKHYLAAVFGVSAAGAPLYSLDIYFAAFRIPDMLFAILSLGVLSTILIPILHKYNERVQRLTSGFFWVFGILLILLCVLGYFTVEFWFPLIAPGFTGRELEIGYDVTRLLLVSPLFLGLSSVFNSFLQSRYRYVAFALAPLFYNAAILLAIIWKGAEYGIYAPVYGVMIGAMLHFLVHVVFAVIAGFRLHLALPDFHVAIEAIGLIVPRIIGMAGHQIALTVEIAIASTIGLGAIAAYQFADSLQNLPIALIGLAISIPALSALSYHHFDKNKAAVQGIFDRKFMQIVFLIIPVSAISYFFAPHIVSLILDAGRFTQGDVQTVSQLLQVFVFSFPLQALIPLLTRFFYAHQDTLYPLLFSLAGLLANIVLAFVLSDMFGLIGIAYAYIIGVFINGLLLFLFTPLLLGYRLPIRAIFQALITGAFAFGIAFALAQMVPVSDNVLYVFLQLCLVSSMIGFGYATLNYSRFVSLFVWKNQTQ